MTFLYANRMSVEFDRFSISVWPLEVAALLLLLLTLWRRKHSLTYLLCASLFGVYALHAVDRLFFPLPDRGRIR